MSTESAAKCPSDDTLVRFSEGLLPGSEAVDVEVHLDSCGDCRELVAIAAGDVTVSRLVADSKPTMDEETSDAPMPGLGDSVGRYVLLHPLGEGAMGVVFAAHDPKLDRTVAIKIVKAASSASQSRRERMIREARSLAMVSHENVVSVFDVGECPAGVFIVMELVEGDDLRQWCHGRSWHEIVECFVEAGRGLAAAHDAGITHRDFKPSNVLVGDDSRVRVTDFGLAGTLGAATSEASHGSEDGDVAEAARLTRTGDVMGTPAYMSPEQFSGHPLTSASDQFSFCVALSEAVAGVRPTVGRGFAELAATVASTATRVDLAHTDAPETLALALRRGLSNDPTDRYPSMRAVVRTLEDLLGRAEPGRRRNLWIAGSVAVVAVGVALAVGPQDDRCARAVANLSPKFDDTLQTKIRARLESAMTRYGEQTADRVGDRLSGFVADWTEARIGLCEAATTHSGEGEFLDRALRCLERQRDDFEAAMVVLVEEATPVQQAVGVVAELGDPSVCLDGEQLADQLGLPPTHARADVRRLEAVIAEVRALFRAFRFKDVKAVLEREQALLEAVEWPPVLAEAMFYQAVTNGLLGDSKAEIEGLTETYELASESGYDRFAFRAASSLVTALAFGAGDYEGSDRWFRAAEAIADRTGSRAQRAAALRSKAEVSLRRSRFEEASDLARNALQLYLGETEGSHHVAIATLQGIVGKVGLYQRDYVSAKNAFEAQLEGYEAIYGSLHPRCSAPLLGLVQVAQAERDWDTASALLDQREAIVLDVFGVDSVRHAHDLALRGVIEEGRGRLDKALASSEAALEVMKKVYGDAHPDLGSRHGRIGLLQMRLGNYRAAHEHHLDAAEMCEKFAERISSCGVTTHHNLGESLSALERYGEALEAYGQALEVAEALYGPDHANRAFPLTGLGEVHLARGEYDEAEMLLRESLRVSSPHPANRSEWAETAFSLARALAEAPDADDQAVREAVELAQEAAARFAESPSRSKELQTARRWLAARK